MERMPKVGRRRVLQAGALAFIISIPGCSDESDEEGEEPEADDDPEPDDDDGEEEDTDEDDPSGELTIDVFEEEGDDGDPMPIEGASVTVDGEDTEEEGETDEAGRVIFTGLEPGQYTVEVNADGYSSEEVETPAGESPTSVGVTLEPEDG